MSMTSAQRKAHEVRLQHLEAAVVRLASAYLAARDGDPGEASKLQERLEAADIEIELIREALDSETALETA